MTPFLRRSITGAVFVLIILGAIMLGRISFMLVFSAISTFCLLEFYNFLLKARMRPQWLYGLFIGLLVFLSNYLYSIGTIGPMVFLGFVPILISIFIIELFRNHHKPLHNIAGTLMGILYVSLPFSLLNHLALNSVPFKIMYNVEFLLGFFFLIWANDTGAYIFGVTLGKHKMFPRLSPKKSWEGLIGGFFLTALTAWIISLFFTNVVAIHWLAIGMISAIMGVFGDLVESMFKRSVGAKDSGKFLPGHGGLLDRFDSVLLAAPVVYVYLEVMMLI